MQESWGTCRDDESKTVMVAKEILLSNTNAKEIFYKLSHIDGQNVIKGRESTLQAHPC
jgi:hypothetical protein